MKKFRNLSRKSCSPWEGGVGPCMTYTYAEFIVPMCISLSPCILYLFFNFVLYTWHHRSPIRGELPSRTSIQCIGRRIGKLWAFRIIEWFRWFGSDVKYQRLISLIYLFTVLHFTASKRFLNNKLDETFEKRPCFDLFIHIRFCK